MKKNCWEFMGCGRQPGGSHEDDLGVCPASTEKKLDGIHGGKNAGRSCWVVAGTMCCGTVQGTFARKCANCIDCEFYKTVIEEESPGFLPPNVLLTMVGEYRGRLPRGY